MLDSFSKGGGNTSIIRKTDIHRKNHAIFSRFPIIKDRIQIPGQSTPSCNQIICMCYDQIPSEFCSFPPAKRPVEGSKFFSAVRSCPHKIGKEKLMKNSNAKIQASQYLRLFMVASMYIHKKKGPTPHKKRKKKYKFGQSSGCWYVRKDQGKTKKKRL